MAKASPADVAADIAELKARGEALREELRLLTLELQANDDKLLRTMCKVRGGRLNRSAEQTKNRR